MHQSPNIGQNSDGGILDFWIPGQSFINENGHNSGTSHDVEMKLGPVTKIDKKDDDDDDDDDDIMLESCGIIVFFPICGHLGVGFQRHGL